MPTFSTPKLEEFYNHVHDGATGRFSGAAGIRVTRGLKAGEKRDFPASMRERVVAYSGGRSLDKPGSPKVGAKLPLRNATTGRINPLPVRHAFKQGLSEIISKRKEDSKRTTLTGPKVQTVKTYKGRVISHVSSKGGVSGRMKP